jgi:hypothetical protein
MHIYHQDIAIGRIGHRAGVPVDVDQWGWFCGFYPISHRGQHAEGTPATFKNARCILRRSLRPQITDAEYREQRAWTAWKYQMRDTGLRLPTELPERRSRCF